MEILSLRILFFDHVLKLFVNGKPLIKRAYAETSVHLSRVTSNVYWKLMLAANLKVIP